MVTNTLLHVTIAKVDGPVFDGKAAAISFTSADGKLELMAHHTPLVTTLLPGDLIITHSDNTQETISVSTGTVEVAHNHATILL